MDNSVTTLVHPVHHPKSRKRFRPVSFPSPSNVSKYNGKAAKRGRDLATLPPCITGLDDFSYWQTSTIMSPVSGTAVILSSPAPVSAEQETRVMVGHESICVPNVVPNQPNMLGGESSIRAIPNMGLQPSDYPSGSHSIPPPPLPTQAFVYDYTTTNPPGLPSYVFPFSFHVPMHLTGYNVDPMYNQDTPVQGFDQDQQLYPVPPDDPGHHYGTSMTLTSHSQPDHAFPPFEYPPNIGPYTYPHDSINGFNETSMISLDNSWYICERELSSEGTDQSSPFELPSAGSSPIQTSEYSTHSVSTIDITFQCQNSDSSTSPSKFPRRNSKSSGNRVGKNKGGRKGKLTEEQQRKASMARQMVACIRCQFQRKTCKPNPAAPNGHCLPCCQIKEMTSKKVIHRFDCVRWKLSSISVFRTGGLKFTTRPGWEGAAMKDLGSNDWASESVQTIRITLGLCDNPIVLRVRKFKPIKGDVTNRFWVYNGKQYETPIEPYALENVRQTVDVLKEHMRDHAYDALKCFVDGNSRVRPHGLVGETYKAAWNHMRTVEWEYKAGSTDNFTGRSLMEDLFKLWYATRNTLGSAWLLGQPGTAETLWMEPDKRKGFPLPGKISLPRLIAQQFDAINYTTILLRLRNNLVKNLWKLMHGKKDPKVFYTVYLVVFVILHEISYTSKDRYWHAEMHKERVPLRYNMEGFMEDLQESANIVLSFWHYYRNMFGNFNPDSDWDKIYDQDEKHKLWINITEKQRELMRLHAQISENVNVWETKEEKEGWEGLVFDAKKPSPLIWERDMHFVSQMFKDNWSAGRTWSRDWDHGQNLSI